MSGENSGSFSEWDIKLPEIEGSVLSTKVRMRSTRVFFIKSPQYKNANIANFVLAMSFKINKTNEVCHLEM